MLETRKEQGMKSVLFNGAKLLTGLLVVMLSTAVSADSKLEPTWVKEGVNWEKYNRFLVRPLEIEDVAIVRPPWAEDDPQEWTLQIESLHGIQAIFRDTMNQTLTANDGYDVVYSAGPDVLEVEVEILSIMPWVRPGSGNTVDGMTVTTLGSGEMTASVELRDSKTRELLLLIEGDKAVGEQYQEFTQANNVANIENMFTAFAKRLRTAMDRVHGKN
jgi:hypothetical protein